MGYGEVQMFIAGYNRRYRASWEQHRSLVGTIAAVCGDTKDMRDIWPLPWDGEGYEGSDSSEYDEQEVKEEYDRMMESIREHNQLVDIMRKSKP